MFCRERNISPFNANVPLILEFLAPLAKSVNNYGTLNNYRSAVALITNWDVGKDPIIKRFCKGVSVTKPQRPKYTETWDPSIALNFMSSLAPNSELKMDLLTMKLATLLALITAQRVQTLSKINISNIILNGDEVNIKIPDKIKTSSIGRYQPNLIIPSFTSNTKICPVNTLECYLQRTELLRGANENGLFVTFKKPYHQASQQTISRWIKQFLRKSGLNTDIFTAHSTRHASTSAAAKNGIDVETIRRTAGWTKNSEVFARCYQRPLVDQAEFAKSILQNTHL